MGIVHELVKDIPVPRMIKVRQHFDNTKIENVEQELKEKLQREAIKQKIRPGMSNCDCGWEQRCWTGS